MQEVYYRNLVNSIRASLEKGDVVASCERLKLYIANNIDSHDKEVRINEVVAYQARHTRLVSKQDTIEFELYEKKLSEITDSILNFLTTIKPQGSEIDIRNEFKGIEFNSNSWNYKNNITFTLKFQPDFGLLKKEFLRFIDDKKALGNIRMNCYYFNGNRKVPIEENQIQSLSEYEKKSVTVEPMIWENGLICQKKDEYERVLSEALILFTSEHEEISIRVQGTFIDDKINLLMDVVTWFKTIASYPEKMKEPFTIHVPFNSLSIFDKIIIPMEDNQNQSFNVLIQQCETEIANDNIEKCFSKLLEVLPENKDLRANNGSLNNLNKGKQLDIISGEEYRRERNKIRYSLIEFLAEIRNVSSLLNSGQNMKQSNPDNSIQIDKSPKTITIFLASSSELEEDRKEFEIFINRENKRFIQKGIFLNLELWEDFIDAVSKTRLQDEYNKVVRESDIFVSLFFTKVGQYTEEEFETAFKQFKGSGKPYVYTYFKHADVNIGSITNDIKTLLSFKEKLRTLEHFRTEYKNVDELKYKFKMQLEKVLPSIL